MTFTLVMVMLSCVVLVVANIINVRTIRRNIKSWNSQYKRWDGR